MDGYAPRPAQDGDPLERQPDLRRDEPRRVILVSVHTSRTAITAPTRSIVQPASLAASSSVERCSPSSKPSGSFFVRNNGMLLNIVAALELQEMPVPAHAPIPSADAANSTALQRRTE
jgi:hypothetical protein